MGARSSQSRGPGLNKSDGHLLEYFRQAFGAGGGANSGPTDAPAGLTATGGVISDYTDPGTGNIYRAHIYTSSGTWDVTAVGSFGSEVDFLLVGGGGGGGNSNGGGGGAGAVHYRTSQPISTSPGSYVITIGGGATGEKYDTQPHQTTTGTASAIPGFPISAAGGGAGGNGAGPGPWSPGVGGGSGGGGATNSGGAGTGSGDDFPGSAPFVSPANGWGNNGGTGSPPVGLGAGGGGAGSAGRPHSDGTYRAAGGDGILIPAVSMAGYELKIAGGGGGGGPAPGGTSGGAAQNAPTSAQYGGAEVKSAANPAPGNHGRAGTGGGGGGGGTQPISDGGTGGSGLAVIRYQIGSVTASARATGGAISFYNNKTIHTFTVGGTFASLPTWQPNTSVEYVIIGGGGGGGNARGNNNTAGGGGGAAAYHTNTTPFSGPFSLTVEIGAGGAYGANNISGNAGFTGGNSSVNFPTGTITSSGGGGGGGDGSPWSGRPGGSGGGANNSAGTSTPGGTGSGDPFPGTIGATPANGWGHNGGAASPDPSANNAGGGGGAGGDGVSGGTGTTPNGGVGGIGIQVPTTFRNPDSAPTGSAPTPAPLRGGGLGTPGPGGSYYIGGGGAAGSDSPSPSAAGGAGGGGMGGSDVPGTFTNGLASTGAGGGGGMGDPSAVEIGGRGGSGIVLIAYPS